MIWIGTSGWVYQHWVGHFYPRDLPQREWLAYYAERFPTVEINRSFYRLPSREQFAAWAADIASRQGFFFAVKGSRYLTHFKKLKDPTEGLHQLVSSTAGLGSRLGPLLFQLPPHWHINSARLADFVRLLPRGQRVAFEFRDPSWFVPEVTDVLKGAGCALVTAIGGPLPTPAEATAVGAFRYLRFHGGRNGVGYTDGELAHWAEHIARADAAGRDVYAYFNNDAEGHAVADALRLRRMLEAER